jgi:hypothetical protein
MNLAGASTLSKVGLTRDGQIYRVGALFIHPNPTELALAGAYLRFSYEETLPAMIHESSMGLSEFLATAQRWPMLACLRQVSDTEYDPLGIGWMDPKGNGEKLRKGECGMSYFRKVPPDETLTLTRMMLTWNFEQNNVDLIYTMIPEENRASLDHTKRVGLTQCGTIPMFTLWEGEPCGSEIFCITRANWETQVKEWF